MQGRKNIWNRLVEDFKKHKSKVIWIHCASLGEFEQGRPIIEKWKRDYPEFKVFLTFFSPSGYEVRKNYTGADFIYYLPYDSRKNAKKLLSIVKPELAILIKYEFWYHYINECSNRQIPVFSASSIFRQNQVFFKRKNSFWKKLLSKVNHFYVQNETSKLLLNSIGIDNVMVTGDTRFDRVSQIANPTKDLPEITQFKSNIPLVIFGSSWNQDVDIYKNAINQYNGKIKVIIAPHEIHEQSLRYIENSIKRPSIRYSALLKNDSEHDILIVDNIGMLSSLYKYADIAYIGGAFGHGLHNTLEAATFGCPIMFGPRYQKFQEAIDLVELKGAFSVDSSEKFQAILYNLLESEEMRKTASETTRKYIENNVGATDRILDHIKQNYLKS